MAVIYSFAFLLTACLLCEALQEVAPPVDPAISQTLTPDKTENNSSAIGSEKEAEGCSCETKSEDGDAITIIDYIFGGDEYSDGDDEYDGWNEYGYGDLQNSGSLNDEEESLQLYKQKRKNKKRHPLKTKSKRKYKKKGGSKKVKLTRGGHRGHKRVKPEQPCFPEKQSTCLNVSQSIITSSQYFKCDEEKDFCVDDCDCPGFQKCCTNACGRRECLPSFHRPAQPTTTAAPVIPESESAVKPEEPTPAINRKTAEERLVIGTASETSAVPAAGQAPVPTPIPTAAPAVHAY